MHQFFEILEKDHQEVKQILSQLEETSDGAAKTREKLFMKLKQELVPHMKAEETHFYPTLGEHKEARKVALESVEEHHVAETVLKELDKLEKDRENWAAKLKVFKEIVEHHIEEEEDEVWEAARKTLDDEQLNKMIDMVKSEKEKVKKKLQ